MQVRQTLQALPQSLANNTFGGSQKSSTMVKLRVTARIIPEASFKDATETRQLLPGEKVLRQLVWDPEQCLVGQLSQEIRQTFRKTYQRFVEDFPMLEKDPDSVNSDIGSIKYIKDDTDDADLDPDLSVYDAFVDSGREAFDVSDQRATVKIIFEENPSSREGSVDPDLNLPRYLIPQPKVRPPVPLFGHSQTSSRKRSVDEAFGSQSPLARIPSSGRPLVRARLHYGTDPQPEDDLSRSLERDHHINDARLGGVENASPDLLHTSHNHVSARSGEVLDDTPNHKSLGPANVASHQLASRASNSLEIPETLDIPYNDIRLRPNPETSRRDHTRSTGTDTNGSAHSASRYTSAAEDRSAGKEESTSDRSAASSESPTLRRKSSLEAQAARTARQESSKPVLITPRSINSMANANDSTVKSPSRTSVRPSSKSGKSKTLVRKFSSNRDIFAPPESDIDDSQMSPGSRQRGTRFTKHVSNVFGAVEPSRAQSAIDLPEQSLTGKEAQAHNTVKAKDGTAGQSLDRNPDEEDTKTKSGKNTAKLAVLRATSSSSSRPLDDAAKSLLSMPKKSETAVASANAPADEKEIDSAKNNTRRRKRKSRLAHDEEAAGQTNVIRKNASRSTPSTAGEQLSHELQSSARKLKPEEEQPKKTNKSKARTTANTKEIAMNAPSGMVKKTDTPFANSTIKTSPEEAAGLTTPEPAPPADVIMLDPDTPMKSIEGSPKLDPQKAKAEESNRRSTILPFGMTLEMYNNQRGMHREKLKAASATPVPTARKASSEWRKPEGGREESERDL